jgi:hypothetical protein
VITTLLYVRLTALLPLVLVFLCSIVSGGARVNKAVNCVIYIT